MLYHAKASHNEVCTFGSESCMLFQGGFWCCLNSGLTASDGSNKVFGFCLLLLLFFGGGLFNEEKLTFFLAFLKRQAPNRS